MTVAVIHNYGSPQFYSWGVTDVANRYPIGSNTLFALGSLSKGCTGDCLDHRLYRSGKNYLSGRLYWRLLKLYRFR
ncbi:serine hydrolase [Enterobacter ludwigii]|uniref:serine hydrolase n=1 Tax=Enterobacter ludwigii TaxID=299767 RepID=UPI003A102917